MNMAAQPFWLVILGLGITGSIVGAITAAIASALNDRSRRRFELRKWRAEFYLRPKLEALRNLHAAMVHSHYEINMRAKARMPQTIQEYREEVERPEMEFFGALNVAEIYLDSDMSKVMHAVLGTLRQMTTSIWLRLPEIFESHGKHADVAVREPEWQPFTQSFDAAHARLSHLLHPDELMKWVEK
jgi:hypothetical protein